MDMHIARARPSNGCARRSNAPSVEQRLRAPRPASSGPTAASRAEALQKGGRRSSRRGRQGRDSRRRAWGAGPGRGLSLCRISDQGADKGSYTLLDYITLLDYLPLSIPGAFCLFFF